MFKPFIISLFILFSIVPFINGCLPYTLFSIYVQCFLFYLFSFPSSFLFLLLKHVLFFLVLICFLVFKAFSFTPPLFVYKPFDFELYHIWTSPKIKFIAMWSVPPQFPRIQYVFYQKIHCFNLDVTHSQ